MKKVDSGEFHNLNQYNDFSEYQPFSAELYYSTEAQKPPVESQQYDESYGNEGGKSVNSEGAESSTDLNDIQKQYDELNQPDSSGAADSSASSNANATQTASTSSSGTAQASSVSGSAGGASTAAASASTAAAGASVGATAVAAVVIVSAAVTGGLIANFDSYVGNNFGTDYVSITVDMDEILSQSNKTYSLSADNFAIEFTDGNSPLNISLVNGKHSYLITGLQPEKTYSYTITCNNSSFGSNSTCYSQTVTTKSVGEPECVYDELNNYVVYDEVTQTASVVYSLYLSDYENKYANSTFYICSSEQTDLNNINHIIYSDDTLDNNNFFKGELSGVIYDELYLYVVAENLTEHGAENVELFTLQLSVNLPEEWKTAKSPAFVVDESAEAVTSQPDLLYVSGSLNKLNENYTYFAYVTQFAQDGTTLVERQEVGLTVDPANMSYSLNGGAYYGVNKFKYVIYTKDDSGNEISVYESADKPFTASQAFGASYNVVEPINAKYEYTAEKLTITVDPSFTSDSDIYSYKLVVDGYSKVYGEYQGTGVAVFEITDFSDLDYIEFTYTDIGAFADGEHVYEMHSPTFIAFGSIFLDLGTTSITMGDGRIWAGGVIDSINESFTYYAYLSQYDQDGTPLCEREEVTLNINAESMSFWFECATYYEVKKFRYVIYTYDNHGDEVIVYDDGEREFTASQEFNATYTKVAPADASINYNENSVIITVDPKFTSKHANEEYKLVVTNSTGEVFGEYQGVGIATISIMDYIGLNEINFTYYDIGTFADGERQFGVHTTTPVTGKAYFVVDESAEAATFQPDSITVNGSLNKLNESYTYSAYVAQYTEDGTALVEREEVTLNIDTANMTYSFECGAYYGAKAYKYVIYTNDGSNEIAVYESAEKEFTAEQAFGATYTKVEPADATIEYTAEKITITVDPEFTSAYSNYSYKLEVTNSTGQVYGEYQGTGVAVIEITDFAGLDEINFTYYDLGEFVGGEQEFAQHTTTGVEFNYIFIDVGVNSFVNQPDSITVSGKLNKLNNNFTYSAYVAQYTEDGTALVEREEVTLNIDTENMTYSFECGAYYGVKAFKYVIYTNDGANEIVVYESEQESFTASQEYSASYTKVEPADATIEYTAEKITITVDPKFTSEYGIYSYKLEVINSTGQSFGEYQGTGVAVIEITDFAGLDEINFTYYDLGEFVGGEQEFAQHTTTGVEFNYIFIDVGVNSFVNQPESIAVNGSLNKLNESFTYYAYVAQYTEDGTALVEREEVTLNIDTENMTYSFECGAYYGVKAFKYVIYTNDGANEIVVYESEQESFTAEQSFSATYNKVEPADATIEYTAEKITITVDPAYTSEYGIYTYKLEVTNSTGQVYGEYQGTGVAVIEITDFAGLDEINFTYYDLGEFAGGEHEFAQHTTTGVAFNYIFISVDESVETAVNQPDSITVSGKLNKLNNNFTYYAYVAQYDQDGTALVDREEVTLNIDTENMTYSFECGAYYGVKTYKYVIYTNDGSNEITVYESEQESFTAEQAFSATYTKVEPADATIEYTAEKITITVDPEFDSTYSIYSYKLEVTNSTGQVYGEYQGTGVAVIEITDFAGLDEINFTYHDIGEFAGGEEQLAEHSTEGVAFCMPTLSFGEEYGFNGQYFTLSYTCDMDYDYANASIDIDVTNGDGVKVYTKRVESVSASGTIILDNYDGEFGNVTVTGTLNFMDNQSDGATHSLELAQADYAMNFSFEVTSVKADLSGYSTEMPVTLGFKYSLPEGYKIKITDTANSLDKTTELVETYTFSDLTKDTEANLTIQATDAEGTPYGEAKTVNISKSAAEAEYVSPTMTSPNPGDALVTYNDDGTINIYRQMIPDAYGRDTISDDERVYYNAFIHDGYYDEEYNFIETDSYDVIGRGKYAVIENVPNRNYTFVYYQMFDYNGVSYVMYAETPSGSLENTYKDDDSDGFEDVATAAVTVSGGQTIVNVVVSGYGKIGNTIIVNGVEYEYDFYSDESATDLTLTIGGEIDVSEVIILFTKQGYNYDAYGASGEITIKGSKYSKHQIKVTAVSA